MGTENLAKALEMMGHMPTNVFGSSADAARAYTVLRGARDELFTLCAALKPFAAFAKAYGPVASALDCPEDHVLLQVGTAPESTVVRLSDLYAAAEALGEEK